MDAGGSLLPEAGLPPRLAGFGLSVMRGVAQVMLQSDPRAGLLFVAAVAIQAPWLALALLWGCVAGTAAAMLAGAAAPSLRDGLFGFNGALVGLALALFLPPGPGLLPVIGMAAALSSLLMAVLTALLRARGLPALTAPFLAVTLAMLAAARSLPLAGPAAPAPPPPPPPEVAGDSIAALAEGVLAGFGQVFLQSGPLAGLVVALGLLLASRRAGLAAVAGSVSGLAVAALLGADWAGLRAGLYGFNGVLVAIALTASLPATARSWLMVGLALLATPPLTMAVGALLAPLGLPGLTLPFVLVTWVGLAIARRLPGPVPAA